MSHDADLSDYLLGELDAAARERFEARLAREPALRAEVERLAPAVARLEGLPEQVWEHVGAVGASPDGAGAPAAEGASVVGAGGAGAAGADAAPAGAASAAGAAAAEVAGAAAGARHGRSRRWLPALPARAWAGAALASLALLGAGVGIGVLIDDGGSGAPVVTAPAIALAPFGGGSANASANARMTGPNRMLLTIDDLPPAPSGSYYEAWLLNDADDLVPVASFSVGEDGRAVLEIPLPAAADHYRFIDVSLQRVDGGTQHSADSVLRGSLS